MAILLWLLLIGAFILLLSIFIRVYIYMTRNFQYWKERNVVQIPPYPFFGNFANYCTLQMSPGYLLKHFYERSENLPYVGIYIFDKPCLVLRDPEIIKQLLIKDFNMFSDKLMHASENDILGNKSLALVGNPQWKIMKSKLSSLYTSSKLKIMFESLQEVTKNLDNYMESLKLEGPGKEINVKEVCAKFTTDVIGITAFGMKFNSLTDPEAEFRKIGKKMTGIYALRRAIELTSINLIPEFANFCDFRFFSKEICLFFRKAFHIISKDREKSEFKKNDLMELLNQLKNEFQEDDLLAQAMILFFAGFDPASSTMSFALYELARNQNIQKKLRHEINNTFKNNNGEITYDQIIHLKYLDKVISETLRVYPALPIIDRIATNDYKIDETGLIIEKGTPILIPMLGLHYDRKYFSNPDIFDPENFSTFNKLTRNPYVYMPFGIGPRSCIGQRQGLNQVKLGIIHIISKFEVTLTKNSSTKIQPLSIFTNTKKDLVLNVRKLGATNV